MPTVKPISLKAAKAANATQVAYSPIVAVSENTATIQCTLFELSGATPQVTFVAQVSSDRSNWVDLTGSLTLDAAGVQSFDALNAVPEFLRVQITLHNLNPAPATAYALAATLVQYSSL